LALPTGRQAAGPVLFALMQKEPKNQEAKMLPRTCLRAPAFASGLRAYSLFIDRTRTELFKTHIALLYYF
jgi:hypothetical protein